jgi:hypothetical protein
MNAIQTFRELTYVMRPAISILPAQSFLRFPIVLATFQIRPNGTGTALANRCLPLSKYPPAEPGALFLEPLKAAGGVADAAPVYGAT